MIKKRKAICLDAGPDDELTENEFGSITPFDTDDDMEIHGQEVPPM